MSSRHIILFILLLTAFRLCGSETAPTPRTDQLLNANWETSLDNKTWRSVDIPHNWDDYQGYRQLRHGNLHDTAWYRRTFRVTFGESDRRIFLFFEGVGSYATVWVNGTQVGQHAGGLTTFTLDITDVVAFDRENLLLVRADHPAGIRDLPWVCGGCERTSGSSEGPQPLGIFRPVHLFTTAPVRIEPFGVHAWIDGPQSENVTLRVDTVINTYQAAPTAFTLRTRLLDHSGNLVTETKAESANTARNRQTFPVISKPRLWSPADPYLYTLVSEILSNNSVIDRLETPFGFRWISWPKTTNPDRRRFFLNGRPFFLNGTADYEHQLGGNFSFSDTQIDARVSQIKAAGFNAFRDAHHPHNLRFQNHWDRDGLLWWTQFGDTTWFDNDTFRTNCKTLLVEWVKERRNSPSLILWGLQNESLLPTAFAEECSALIRELDPTASTQRLITTCNGGTGTDWDVPQNWSGTYSGDPEKYDDDLRQSSLIGEYGAWRSLGLHSEGGFVEKGPLSEDRFCALMETKIRLADKARADSCGHFQWPFTSHANPGRNFGERGEQLLDGIRPLDRIGPVNNKGLFTIWGEPTDGFYLFRANFAPKETQPMAYIVSHTWPDRWTTPGKKSGIIVYSNCDEVELFNGSRSLGRRVQGGRGTHFQWDDVEIDCNLLRAEARVAGKPVATDTVRLNHLPAPKDPVPPLAQPDPTIPIPGQHYLYRINCGGPDYTDSHGNLWIADRTHPERFFGVSSVVIRHSDPWFSTSWMPKNSNLPELFGSQRKTFDPVIGTHDEALFQTFRYGRNQLSYAISVPAGDFMVELFFIEPWYGTGGGLDCTDWRVFDVAINGKTVLQDLDLWREAGRSRAIKKTISVHSDGYIYLTFPRIAAGQALISAIAVSSKTSLPMPKLLPSTIELSEAPAKTSVMSHLDTGDRQYSDINGAFTTLPTGLFEADWIRTTNTSNKLSDGTILHFKLSPSTSNYDVWVAHDDRITAKPSWLSGWERTALTLLSGAVPETHFTLYRHYFEQDKEVSLGANGSDGAMYTVFVTPSRPLAKPQFVILSESSVDWIAAGHAQLGMRLNEKGTALSQFPTNLSDSDLLFPRSTNAVPEAVQFSVNDHVEIVGAFSNGSVDPFDWIETTQTATTSDGATYKLHRRRVPANTQLVFSPNASLPKFAFIRAVRPSITYSPVRSASGFTEWTIQVGVGDRYGLNFNYRNLTPAAISATLEIVQANGLTLRTDPLEFAPSTSKTEWSILRARTGESINAGTYTLRIKLASPESLQLSNLEIE